MDDTAAGFTRSWGNSLEAEIKTFEKQKGKKLLVHCWRGCICIDDASARSRRYLTQLPKSRAHY
jgi:hypothetical protein